MSPTSDKVTIRVPNMLAPLVGDVPMLTVPLAETVTVAGLLDLLREDYPVFSRRVRDETGALRRYVNVYVDGEDVRRLAGTATEVRAGQEVEILQSVAGG